MSKYVIQVAAISSCAAGKRLSLRVLKYSCVVGCISHQLPLLVDDYKTSAERYQLSRIKKTLVIKSLITFLDSESLLNFRYPQWSGSVNDPQKDFSSELRLLRALG